MMRLLCLSLLLVLMAASPTTSARPLPPGANPHAWPPRSSHFQHEHPQHRLAYWYANESMAQSSEARQMGCGFTGQHWVLDWTVHYRWGLRAAQRRIYQRIEEREQHLSTCRSRRLRDYQREPYRRGGIGRQADVSHILQPPAAALSAGEPAGVYAGPAGPTASRTETSTERPLHAALPQGWQA